MVPLSGTGLMRWPIVALEFVGEGPLNLLILGHLVPAEGPIVLPCDSLVAPLVMAGRARESKFTRYLHQAFMELDIVKSLYHRLYASQEYGVGNPVTDRLSRGGEGEALEILQHLRHRPVAHAQTQTAVDFLADADAFYSSLTEEQLALERAVMAELANERAAARAARDLRRAAGRRPARRGPNAMRLAAIAAMANAGAATGATSSFGQELASATERGAPFSSSSMGDGPPPWLRPGSPTWSELVADDQDALHQVAAYQAMIDDYEAHEHYLHGEWWWDDTGELDTQQLLADIENDHPPAAAQNSGPAAMASAS